jgi:nucleoside-diphosphate-sugar epimerase
MHALVTGAAGFIGSHLAERLLSSGWDVLGVDALTPYYDMTIKRATATDLSRHGVDVQVMDLRTADLRHLLDGVDVVFHFAAQPGVRHSWDDFDSYVGHNLLATQRLLDAARHAGISRFVFASSSSVYGQVTGAVTEQSPTRPYSPYGVTKLAAESLCTTYADNFGVPTVSLRLFTVYGPRQRPDMALHRIIRAALTGQEFTVLGDGSAVRSFTYVDDVADAAVRAATADVPPGTILNISGGSATALREVIDTVGLAVGKAVPVRYEAAQAGDVQRTDAAADLARHLLGWEPSLPLGDGIARQVEQVAAQLGLVAPAATSPGGLSLSSQRAE